MTVVKPSLGDRFRTSLASYGEEGRFVVAVSGGLDSCVLLHLARFEARHSGREWIVAHFDHGMRSSSAADARWVVGLCRAWNVPVHVGRADVPPTSEEQARDARYEFLREVRERTGASVVLTAHHADDQAETVLFRLLRGTGSFGLRGIPARRGPAIVRPLLDAWRTELVEYAMRVRLSWREDPTNRSSAFARNALRNRIIPDIERLVSSGARRALVRLAAMANDEEAAWGSVLPALMAPLDVREVEGGVSLDRANLLELHPAVRARVIRALAADLGAGLDHRTTHLAVEFAASGQSGRAIDLGGWVSLGVELDRCVLGRAAPAGEERALAIADTGPGQGSVVLAGTPIPVAWGGREPASRRRSERFDVRALRFPLVVRSRRPGDRIRLAGGTKKVKKVLLESRIPPSERHRVPLVVDAEGQVLWIPGLARAEWTDVSDSPRWAQDRDRLMRDQTDHGLRPVGEPHQIVFGVQQIDQRVRELAAEISAAYEEEDRLLVLGFLKGAFIFMADLVRAITVPHQVDFLVASSYGAGEVSTGDVRLLYDPASSLEGRAVLIVEDIIDSGATLRRLLPRLQARGPSSLEICALLRKRLGTVEAEPRWVGFDAPNDFLVGYGLDHAEDFRHLPYIASL